MSLVTRLLIGCSLASYLTLAAVAQTLVISDVTLINPRRNSTQEHCNVVIEGERIRAITAASSRLPQGSRVVNGRGKFLIPGLWDAHVHLTKAGVLSLPLFVANGITGVRDMGSDLSEVMEWRTRVAAGQLIGPRIKTSGQILESRANVKRMKRERTVEPVDRIRIGIDSADEARQAVDRLAAAGVDHIKMRSTPDAEAFFAAADQARRRHLPFTAHPIASPDELLRAGISSVEHFLAYPPLSDRTAPERRALFRRLAKAGMYMSNTTVNITGLFRPYPEGKRLVDDANGRLDPRRKYLCGYLIEDWREQVEENKNAPYAELQKEMPHVYRDLREMREEGVRFLAGTDVGVVFIYPGFSLHDELEELVQHAGFTPMEALRVATDGVPTFYGEMALYGAIEPGQAADLVLLDANPLVDIRNTRRVEAVSVRGRWLDRADLNKLLRQIEHSARTGCRDLSE